MSGKRNKPRACWLVAILILLGVQLTNGQATYRLQGHVHDSLGAPVIAAQVVLYDGASLQDIRAFATTDGQGAYSLSVTTVSKRLRIRATALGYRPDERDLQLTTATRLVQNFRLHERYYELQEVEISVERTTQAVRPSDTLSFAAADLRLGDERTVEQLVDRIPGADVSDNGWISIMGKPVSRILIEGDDLTGGNYQLASRGISANLIDSLEVIDNYLESSILSGVMTSDELVINLKLSPEIGLRLSGEAELGGGWRQMIDSRFNGFSLSGRQKALLLAKATTTGEQPVFLDDGWYNSEVDELIAYPSPIGRTSQIFRVGHPASGLANEQWANFNRAFAASAGMSWRPNARWKTKALLTGVVNKEEGFLHQDSWYLLSEDTLRLTETTNYLAHPRSLSGRLLSEYLLTDKMALQLRVEGRRQPDELSGQDRSWSDSLYSELPWQLRRRSLSLVGEGRWLWRINPFQATVLSYRSKTDQGQSAFSSASGRYADFLAFDSLAQRYHQHLEVDQHRSDLQYAWLYNRGRLAIEQAIGYRSEEVEQAIRWRETYWQQQWSYRFGHLLLEAESRLGRLQTIQKSSLDLPTISTEQWIGSLQAEAIWKWSRKQALTLHLSHSPQTVSTLDLIGSGWLRDLRSWQPGAAPYELFYESSLSLNWRYDGEAQGLRVYASAYRDWSVQQYVPEAYYRAFLDVTRWQPGAGYSNTGVSLTVEKYIFPWRTALHLKYNISANRLPLQIAELELTAQVFLQQLRFGLVKDLGPNWRLRWSTLARQSWLNRSDLNASGGSNWRLQPAALLQWQSTDRRIKVEGSFEQLRWWSNNSYGRPLNFLRFRIGREGQDGGHWELEGLNLLQQGSAEQWTISAVSSTRSVIRLVPRSLILRYRFQF